MKALLRLIKDESGDVTVETALMLVMVSIASYVAYQAFGDTIAGHVAQANEQAFGTTQ